MKKFVVMCLLFVFPLLAFAGCGTAEASFWAETYDVAHKLFTVSENTTEEGIAIASVLTKNATISYEGNSDFVLALTNHAAYEELELYETLLNSNLLLIHEYLEQIDFTPTLIPQDQLKNVEKQFSDFEAELETLKKGVKAFLTAKASFENKTTRTDFVASSAPSLQHLRDFKLAYATLIGKAIDLNNKFSNLYIGNYTTRFLNITTESPLTVPYMKLSNIMTRKLIAESFFQMIVQTSAGQPIHSLVINAINQLNYSQQLTTDATLLETSLEAEGAVQLYQANKEVFLVVESEKQLVQSLLSNISLPQVLTEIQLREEPFVPTLNQQYAQAVLTFWETSVELLNETAFAEPA